MEFSDFLDHFEKTFRANKSLDVARFTFESVPTAFRMEALSKTLEIAFQVKKYDYDWLSQQLNSPDLQDRKEWKVTTLRSIFSAASKFERLFWGSKIAVPGITLKELKLQWESERFPLGSIIGKYEILDRIGQGGALVVYRGKCISNDSFYTIRIPRLDPKKVDKNFEVLRKEFSVLEKLSGLRLTGVQSQIEWFEVNSIPISVCEYVEGQNLASIANEIRDPREALAIVAKVTELVAVIHEAGYIHGDIKRENVLRSPDGTLTLIDFNVSLPLDPKISPLPPYSGTLSSMGLDAIAGSAAEIDVRRDIYALGTLLYELVEEKPLIEAGSREDAFVALAIQPLMEEPRYSDDTPLAVRSIVDIAVSRDPNNRFEDCRDFLQACSQAVLCPDEVILPNRDRRFIVFRIGRAIGEISRRIKNVIPVSRKAKLLGGIKGLDTDERNEIFGFASIGEERRNILFLSEQADFRIPDPDEKDFFGAIPFRITRPTPELFLAIDENLSSLQKWEEDVLTQLSSELGENSFLFGLLALGFFFGKHRQFAAMDANFQQLKNRPDLCELFGLIEDAVSDSQIKDLNSRMQHCERLVRKWLVHSPEKIGRSQ